MRSGRGLYRQRAWPSPSSSRLFLLQYLCHFDQRPLRTRSLEWLPSSLYTINRSRSTRSKSLNPRFSQRVRPVELATILTAPMCRRLLSTAEVTRLQNSVKHLRRSNDELKAFCEGGEEELETKAEFEQSMRENEETMYVLLGWMSTPLCTYADASVLQSEPRRAHAHATVSPRIPAWGRCCQLPLHAGGDSNGWREWSGSRGGSTRGKKRAQRHHRGGRQRRSRWRAVSVTHRFHAR